MYNKLKYTLKILIFKIKSLQYNFTHYNKRVKIKQILLQSFHGNSFSDSPKAIYNEIIKNQDYRDYTIYWAFTNPQNYNFENTQVKVIKYASKEYFNVVATSKYIITSTRLLNFITLKPEQVYIQTWHGTPLKKLGADINYTTNIRTSVGDYKLMNKLDSKRISHFISPSKFASEKFMSAFDLCREQILEIGYPRNDFLITHTLNDICKYKEKLKIPKNKKVVLYAPTWRDDSYKISEGYIDNCPISIEELANKLKDYVFLYRSHYMSKAKQSFTNIIDVSNYDDINHLYIISDILITDYSSVFFDFALLKKPMIFYMYDLKTYQHQTRGFYLDIEKTLPGKIITENELLVQEIRNAKTHDNIDNFIKQFASLEDGKAAKRVVEKLFLDET